jgi:hypothetical protein
MIRCTQCFAARHCEAPRDIVERGIVIAALVTFGLAHQGCEGRGRATDTDRDLAGLAASSG